jgi:thiamine pyrophosphate-dependent acetolactate synthase large subunit-like protein
MGFGLPAAMGAELARPKSRVISLSGDGGFKMTGSELFTIASYKLPVTAIVFNNSGLGMIRQLQTVQFSKRFTACEFPGYVDFVKYGEAFGVKGEHVTTPEQLAAAVEKAMEIAEGRANADLVDFSEKELQYIKDAKGAIEYLYSLLNNTLKYDKKTEGFYGSNQLMVDYLQAWGKP